MTLTNRPEYARYRQEPIGQNLAFYKFRDTLQIPDHILNRPSAPGNRFFEALDGPNRGYVFRLRECNPETDFKVVEDCDWFGRLKPSYRLECFVKGSFKFFVGDFDEESVEQHWACICFNPFLPLGVTEIEDINTPGDLKNWLQEIIGPFREVSFQDSGKWSWAQGFAPNFVSTGGAMAHAEPWTVMYEQQFASLFSQIVTFGKGSEVQTLVEKYMTGYREWLHFKTPLKTPITLSDGVPEDWEPDEFWTGWRGLGEFGELLFDFWARDLDPWWLDTFRKRGYSFALVPNGSKLYWTEEVEVSDALSIIQTAPEKAIEIHPFSKAQDLRNALIGNFESQNESSISLARQSLYRDEELNVSYENYPAILAAYLDKLNFWANAENFLEAHSCGFAIVPLRGRSLIL